MDSTQRQVMKAERPAEDESSQAGWLLLGSAPLLVGGVALLLTSSNAAQWTGAMLTVIGLALVSGAVWLRVGPR